MSPRTHNRVTGSKKHHGMRAQAAMILLAAGLAAPASADILSWNTGAGTWSNVNNWTPLGQPFFADTARIGNLAGIANNTVTMNVHATVAALDIRNGMTLRTATRRVSVVGLTTISGQNIVGSSTFPTTLRVETNGGYEEFSTDQLTISNSGRLRLDGGVGVLIDGSATLQTEGMIFGSGIVTFSAAGTVLTNDGVIHVSGGTGMTLVRTGGGRFDLDGTSGNGEIIVDTQNASALQIIANGLTDSFGGSIHLTSDSRLLMSLWEGWTADASSSITVEGILDLQARPAARIEGFPGTYAGTIAVEGFAGDLLVQSTATLQPTLEMSIGVQDRATFGGLTTVNGGVFNIAQQGELVFTETVMHAGIFNTPSNIVSDGSVAFGTTEWDGTVAIFGVGRQENTAEVTGPSTITATTFDMDGTSGDITWDINAPFTVNASQVDTTTANRLNGTINVAGGLAPRLTINLPAPAGWIMDGTMNLHGQTTLFEERVAGSPVSIQGALNVVTGKVRITADTTFSSLMGGAQVSIAPVSALLVMAGETVVEPGAHFSGLGTLQVSTIGDLTLSDGASLGPVGLINQGDFRVDALAGGASVDRFQNTADGTWHVSIGGLVPADQHDLLIVSGGAATLAGTISVDLIDAGGGFFQPQVGQQFTVLTALGGVNGTFLGNPVTVTPSGAYSWTVIYQTNAVVLQLTSFVPSACYANCDNSTAAPVLNVNDFTCFLNKYAAADPYANCDNSTVAPLLNVNDFTCFLNKYAAGCP